MQWMKVKNDMIRGYERKVIDNETERDWKERIGYYIKQGKRKNKIYLDNSE